MTEKTINSYTVTSINQYSNYTHNHVDADYFELLDDGQTAKFFIGEELVFAVRNFLTIGKTSGIIETPATAG